MAGFGVSFVPSDQNTPNTQNPLGQAGGAPPLQQAIQLLSLRLPRVVGSQGLAPGPLLQSPGGAGMLELLKQMFGQGQSRALPGGNALPLPNIKPGIEAPPSAGGMHPSGGSGYPDNPWSDFPMPRGPMGPTNPSPAAAPSSAPSMNRDWLTPPKNY